MSEPSAGTDVLGLTTKAVEQPDGSFVLNGGKMWITNGAVSDTELGDVFLVYAVRPTRRVPSPPRPPTTCPPAYLPACLLCMGDLAPRCSLFREG